MQKFENTGAPQSIELDTKMETLFGFSLTRSAPLASKTGTIPLRSFHTLIILFSVFN